MPKCNNLLGSYFFQPVTMETTGVYGETTASCRSSLAKKLFVHLLIAYVWRSQGAIVTQCFYQYLAVVKSNAASILLVCVQVLT